MRYSTDNEDIAAAAAAACADSCATFRLKNAQRAALYDYIRYARGYKNNKKEGEEYLGAVRAG